MHSEVHCNYSTHKVFSVFTSCFLVAVSNGGHSPSSEFLNCPWPQLPASHFSQLQLLPDSTKLLALVVQRQHRPHRKRLFHHCMLSHCRENMSTELFHSNSCCSITCLHSFYLAMGLRVTIHTPISQSSLVTHN
jgi:hypothetical protein